MEDLVVRIGTPADVHEVMDLAVSGSEENGFVQPSADRLLGEIWPALNRDRGLMGVVGPPSPADLAHATDCARRLHSLTYGATETAPALPLMATQATLFGAKK